MGIKFEGTFRDGVTIDMNLGEDVDLPTLLEEFKHFIAACGYVVNPFDSLEFVNHEEAILEDRKLIEENHELKRKVRKLQKRLQEGE